jgi:hypothetical protein
VNILLDQQLPIAVVGFVVLAARGSIAAGELRVTISRERRNRLMLGAHLAEPALAGILAKLRTPNFFNRSLRCRDRQGPPGDRAQRIIVVRLASD